jgi:hypothetical protein
MLVELGELVVVETVEQLLRLGKLELQIQVAAAAVETAEPVAPADPVL